MSSPISSQTNASIVKFDAEFIKETVSQNSSTAIDTVTPVVQSMLKQGVGLVTSEAFLASNVSIKTSLKQHVPSAELAFNPLVDVSTTSSKQAVNDTLNKSIDLGVQGANSQSKASAKTSTDKTVDSSYSIFSWFSGRK